MTVSGSLDAGHINGTRTAVGKELATGYTADNAFRGTAGRPYVGTVTQPSLGSAKGEALLGREILAGTD